MISRYQFLDIKKSNSWYQEFDFLISRNGILDIKNLIFWYQEIGHGGPLIQRTSSLDQKAKATNRMHSRDPEAFGKKCCYFWFHSEVKFVTRFWRIFGLSYICVFLCNVYRFLCDKELYLHKFCVITMFISGRMHIVKILILEKNYIYIYEGEKGRGCTSACICMETHSQPLVQNCLMDIYKLARVNVLRTPHICIDFWAPQCRIQVGAEIDMKATPTKQMHGNYLEACGKKCCYFWFYFWRVFDVFRT